MVGDPAVPVPDTGFEVVRRGYDQAQVEEHLRRLDAHVRILVHDREAAADQSDQLARELNAARARTERLREQVRTLVSPPQSVQGMSERMRSMLRLAEDEVAEMSAQAEGEADRCVREAEQRAAEIVRGAEAEADEARVGLLADTERAVQECARERDTIAEERRAADAELGAADAQAEQDRAAAWVESEARRALVEEDFRIAMDQRRSEALATLTVQRREMHAAIEEQRESAAATARATVEDAQAQARRIVADAERRVVELTALRRRIVDQLRGSRAVLDRSLNGLDPLPEERADPDAGVSPEAEVAATGDVDSNSSRVADPAETERSTATGSAAAPSAPRPSPQRHRSPSAAGAGGR